MSKALSPPSLVHPERPLRGGLIAVLVSQYFSTFADNAVLFLAIALLKQIGSPESHTPYLQESFVAAFILLAPFVGPFADAWPKGRVLLAGGLFKLAGAVGLLSGINPFLCYGAIGIGAAMLSPAKSGILSELCPADWLVKANSLLEASTVIALLTGAVFGGRYADQHAHTSLAIVTVVYLGAVISTFFIPTLKALRPQALNAGRLLWQFWPTVSHLLADPATRLSLVGTALFWGVAAVLRFLLIAWLPEAMDIHDLATASYLTAVTALGVAIGAVAAGQLVPLDKVFRVVPAGAAMGVLVALFAVIHSIALAVVALLLIGALGGFFIVPLNALLQKRGLQLVGTGGAIAVQNLVDNAGMMLLVGIYMEATNADLSAKGCAIAVGGFLFLVTGVLQWQVRLAKRAASSAGHDSVINAPSPK
jgi:LPLT family lysophospholipid transporter-like MFS transporter